MRVNVLQMRNDLNNLLMQQESLKVDSLAQAKAVIIDLEAALEEKK